MSKAPDYPQELGINCYLMCAPFVSSFNNEQPNNPLMDGKEKINYGKAFNQWLNLYRFLSEYGLVYVLPNEGWYQDQIYVANLGLVVHNKKEPTVILSNFTSKPRRGEEIPGRHFFSMMKYKCVDAPFHFEGEADCKYIRDNIYCAGYGIRSDIRVYQWMQDNFNCRIIPIQMYDRYCYHFDCCFFVLDNQNALVNTSILSDSDVNLIEKHINIISVPKELRYTGITNLCRTDSIILSRDLESNGNSWLSKICSKYGYSVKFLPLNEFNASGADLSCCVMHMNKPTLKPGRSVVAGVKNFFNSQK